MWQIATVLTVLMVPLAVSVWVWSKHQWAADQLEQVGPRYARLAGLVQAKERLAQAEASAKALLAAHAYPAEQDAVQAGNDAQQRIRSLFADSKLDVGSIQVLPPKELAAFDRIGIVLRVEGDLTGVQNALTLLEKQSPTVWVDSVSVQTVGVVKPKMPQRLSAQFNFSVLRVRS
ncbi:type II secretion system protein GspM [Paracidovorax sp. MALMAid1276]|uniref:type II secretion system protein GspM n=1 Tax=Paracidovorax sp. MALMAid1276 TaxID=3411631 RepID=UPI003B9C340F